MSSPSAREEITHTVLYTLPGKPYDTQTSRDVHDLPRKLRQIEEADGTVIKVLRYKQVIVTYGAEDITDQVAAS